jgi:hypothetical protein
MSRSSCADAVFVGEIVGWIARSCNRRRLGGHAQADEYAAHDVALGDDRDDAQPAVALGAFESVHGATPAEQPRPVDTRLRHVEYAIEKPIPVPDGDGVGGQRRSAAGAGGHLGHS